jgi:hypothetical protein
MMRSEDDAVVGGAGWRWTRARALLGARTVQRAEDRRLTYLTYSFNHTRTAYDDEEKTAVPDWVCCAEGAGSC